MATDYCATNTVGDPYPCDNVSMMVLSMRSLATAGVYFSHRDRRSELLDLRGLCHKVWRRLQADALGCTSAAAGGRRVARKVARGTVGPGDGYRLQFNSEPEVQEFSPYDSVTVAGSSVGSGPLHSIHGIDDDGQDMSYQLMEDDDTA